MTELTKEQLIEEAKLKIAITKCHPHSGMARVEGELFKIALASLEAEPIAWRYRYVKKGVMDSQGELWVGDWKYVPKKEDCNDRPNYEIQALFTAPPVPVTSEELVKAVHFYEQLKRENPPASGNQINGLTMPVKRPAD
ncbi:hypothetical protein LGZ29_002553 [Escherichia coli]|uniref:hypothetical protein n=1 Tax=Escherichia coli TaxID=562 RepID=UPI0002245322|nr:hypothetical protein [Escherichia coli]EMC8921595.1 hypothetical protein [Shigella sonnei]EGW69014.1 ycgB [Escherichia coli STEC_C165-02]EHO4368199.1 hypothetical protein [Escherichia coli]EIH5455317.1 hypothetical protein [Escherichia coli]EIH8293777.1 hypothetical protein [Escherichia coli]